MPDDFKIDDYRYGTAGRVPCPKCGTLIIDDATHCYACGVHFTGGTAYDFSGRAKPRGRAWARWLTIAGALLALIGALVGFLVGLGY
jgi:hypothetical protein